MVEKRNEDAEEWFALMEQLRHIEHANRERNPMLFRQMQVRSRRLAAQGNPYKQIAEIRDEVQSLKVQLGIAKSKAAKEAVGA